MGWEYGASEVRRYHRSSITIPRAGSSLMFRKLHRYRFLKARHTDRAALVGFMGGLIADIAAQHQEGSPRRPSHLKSGLPARPLLGFSAQDLRTIEALLISHLADAGK
jgi:phage virion morphogenesis protein